MSVTSTNISGSYNQNRASEIDSLSVSSSQKPSRLCQRQTAYKVSICGRNVFFSSSWYSSSVSRCHCLRKRSHRQQIEIAIIQISVEPSLDPSPNILSVSICLQFFLRSLPPSLPPFCSAPIGSRSCSAGCLPAPSHQNLATAARICQHTNRSRAFCLWMNGTGSEGRDKVKGGKRKKKRKGWGDLLNV